MGFFGVVDTCSGSVSGGCFRFAVSGCEAMLVSMLFSEICRNYVLWDRVRMTSVECSGVPVVSVGLYKGLSADREVCAFCTEEKERLIKRGVR